MNHIIFDSEVFAHEWIIVFKDLSTSQYTVFHNDPDGLVEYLYGRYDSIFFGFNNKHYDNYIIKGIVGGLTPEEIKQVNDYIIGGGEGWECPYLRNVGSITAIFHTSDLKDDCQDGLSLKAIEAHLGMDIRESEVDFDIDRWLTPEEVYQTVWYCKHDVDATERLYGLRQDYLNNKVYLGAKAGISEDKALYMTNAKLTAAYLGAVRQERDDEREYRFPTNILFEYIPDEVKEFFERMHDPSVSDEELFSSKLDFRIGEGVGVIGMGGIHLAIPNYKEEENEGKV